MKKNLAVLIVAGIPLLTNAYTITIHNNSSVKMKLKEQIAWCFKITPRKLILNPGETNILTYEFFKTYDFCNPDINMKNISEGYQVALKGYPANSEDPELEEFSYVIKYYHNEANTDAAICKPYKNQTKVCLWASMSDINKEYAPYKITADFDSVTISDK